MPRQKTYDVAVVGAARRAWRRPPRRVMPASLASSSSKALRGWVVRFRQRCIAACAAFIRASREIRSIRSTAAASVEVIANMVRQEPRAVVPRQLGKTWVLEFPFAAWDASLNQVCSGRNVDRLMNCRVVAIRRNDAQITALQTEGAESEWLDVGAVIDCTGGVVLQMAGPDVTLPCDNEIGRMLGGFSVRLAGLTGNLEMLRLQTPYALAQGVNEGRLPREARFTIFHPGPGDGEGICKLAINPEQFASTEVGTFAERVIQYLRSEISGFSAARVLGMSPRALARDGTRLRGKLVVTEDDVMQARQVRSGRSSRVVADRAMGCEDGPSYAYPPEGDHYDIPSGALQSAVIMNLFSQACAFPQHPEPRHPCVPVGFVLRPAMPPGACGRSRRFSDSSAPNAHRCGFEQPGPLALRAPWATMLN